MKKAGLAVLVISGSIMLGGCGLWSPTLGRDEGIPAEGKPETEVITETITEAITETITEAITETITEELSDGEMLGSGAEVEDTMLTVTDTRVDGAEVLTFTDKEEFLGAFGFEGEEPYFCFRGDDDELQLELYYEENRRVGCGIRYYPDSGMGPEGFAFNGSGKYGFLSEMKHAGAREELFSTLSVYGTDGRESVEEYEEVLTCTEEGYPDHYRSQGEIDWLEEQGGVQTLLDIDFIYREDGTLQEKKYSHNSYVFGTWACSRDSFFDTAERMVYEECYITHGSMEYYYIYGEEESTPSYCLILDHTLDRLCAELMEYHADSAGEADRAYGQIGPALAGYSESNYAKAVREAGDYDEGAITHTYEADYDRDGDREAFVIIGEVEEEIYLFGDLWFVDAGKNAVCLKRSWLYRPWQQYISQDGELYLFINYNVGNPWVTDIYTVREQEPIILSEDRREKYVDKEGQVIQIQDAYDTYCELGYEDFEDGLWTGHTWKPYRFYLEKGALVEVPAREVAKEEAEQMAPLPAETGDIPEGSETQFILRENGELNINVAVEEDTGIRFYYMTCQPDENGKWRLLDQDDGFYRIQLSGDSHWKYLDEKLRQNAEGLTP